MKKVQIINGTTKGKIVIAKEAIRKDELVIIGYPDGYATQRDMYSLQINSEQHIYLKEPACFLSHSCVPNLYLKDNELGGYNFYAIKDIEPNEELSFHYGMCEEDIVGFSKCDCQTENCADQPIGFKQASPELQSQLYQLGIADYLKAWYENGRS